MKFNYQGKTNDGQLISGVVEASNLDAAADILTERGVFIIFLEEEKRAFYEKEIRIFKGVSVKDIITFSRELSVMLKSKVPIVEVLQTLADEMKNEVFKEKILQIAEDVEGGQAISQAFGKFPEIFSPFYLSMIKSGEALGRISDVFDYLAEHIEKEYNFTSKIKAAMIYPIFVFVVLLSVLSIMMFFVVPQLVGVLKENEQAIPLPTQIVIWLSDFTVSWGWLVLVLLAVGGLALYRIAKTEQGKKFFDENLLQTPALGGFLKKIYLSRFSSSFSTLISGGIPIADALEITAEVMGNVVYRNIVLTARDEVKKGQSLSSIFKNHPDIITPLFTQMVVVGEKTGTLDSTLLNIVDFYQKDVDRSLDSFIKLLEPAMIVVLGLIVAGLMGAILFPLYQSYSM